MTFWKISRTKTSVISVWVPQNPLLYTTMFYVTWLTNMHRLESRRFVIVHMLQGSLKTPEQIKGKQGNLNTGIDKQIYQKMPKVSQLTTNSIVISWYQQEIHSTWIQSLGVQVIKEYFSLFSTSFFIEMQGTLCISMILWLRSLTGLQTILPTKYTKSEQILTNNLEHPRLTMIEKGHRFSPADWTSSLL